MKLLLVVILLTFSAKPAAATDSSKALLDWIEGLLIERNELWETGQDTATDISGIVCHKVSIEEFEYLTTTLPNAFAPLEIRTQHPEGTKGWKLTRGIWFLKTQVFQIYLGPSGYCRAIYRHISF